MISIVHPTSPRVVLPSVPQGVMAAQKTRRVFVTPRLGTQKWHCLSIWIVLDGVKVEEFLLLVLSAGTPRLQKCAMVKTEIV